MMLTDIDIADWGDLTVSIQGERVQVRVERIANKPCLCVAWDRAGAGVWQVRVCLGGETSVYDINILPAKLSTEQLAILVNDLEERLPASIVAGLDRLGAFAALHWKPPSASTLAQEFEQVTRALSGHDELPGLLSVLREVAAQPHHVLSSNERWTRVEAARRPIASRLTKALTRPGNLLAENIPLRVLDSRVEISVDTYENRVVREFSDQVDRRLRTLERAAAHSLRFRDTHGGLLRELRGSFRAARTEASFLDHVSRLRTAPDRLTQVLLRRPAYRSAVEGYVRFRQSARVRLDHPAMHAPMQDVPTLYELWGTLIVVAELLDVAEMSGWKVESQRLATPGVVEPLVSLLTAGRVLELTKDDAFAELHVQRSFSRFSTDIRSISFEQRPDLVLEVQRPGGDRSLHIFDPKYKLSNSGFYVGPAKEDIDKMHAYRDAIRDFRGTRVVCSAGILYPGCNVLFDDGIGAYAAVPGDTPLALRNALAAALESINTSSEGPRYVNE